MPEEIIQAYAAVERALIRAQRTGATADTAQHEYETAKAELNRLLAEHCT
jgi:hypothetical protein